MTPGTTPNTGATKPSTRRLVLATLGAILVAALVLVVAVLPAEYGIDPLGTGQKLGLLELSQNSGVIEPQDADFKLDTVEFFLGPFESIEYKYRLNQGASMVYAWSANAELLYDFHAEPDGAPEGYAESFDQQRATASRGTYHAPFSGIHGWFWENRTQQDVTVRLWTSGFYTEGLVISSSGEVPRPLIDIKALEDHAREP